MRPSFRRRKVACAYIAIVALMTAPPSLIDKIMGEVGAAAGKTDPDRRARTREHFALFVKLEQVAAEDVDQPSLGIKDRDHMDALIEQLEDLLARAAGAGPNEMAVDAGRDRLADGSSGEQLSPDVTVGDRPDHASIRILREQDAKHVDVEAPKRFFDSFSLGDGGERPIQQFSGPKGPIRPRLRGKPRSGSIGPVACS